MNNSIDSAQQNPKSNVTNLIFEEGGVEEELLNIFEHLKAQGSVILRGADITLQDINNIRALLHTNGYNVYHDFGPSSVSPPSVYIAAYRVPTWQDAQQAGTDDLWAYCAKKERDFFERIYIEMAREEVAVEMNMVNAAIRLDESYRLGWVANLSQAFVMEGMEHYSAQQGAASFLQILANVDARKDKHFQCRPPEEKHVDFDVTAPTVENEEPHVKIYVSEKDYQAYLVSHYVNELMSLLGLPMAQPVTTDTKPRVRVHPDGYVPPAENATRIQRANQLLDLIFSMPIPSHSAAYARYPKFMQLAFFANTLGAENVWFKLLDD